MSDSYCYGAGPKPVSSMACFASVCGDDLYAYSVSGPGPCSASCGAGTATRTVQCVDHSGVPVDMSICLSELDIPVPSTTVPCDAGVCEANNVVRLPAGDCTVLCGGGLSDWITACANNMTRALTAPEVCGIKSAIVMQPCGVTTCPLAYRWQASDQWEPCSKQCGGGIATRAATCVRVSDGTVSNNPLIDCPSSMPKPAVLKSCNTWPCLSYSYSLSAWSSCPDGCGSSRVRTVSCVSSNGSASLPVSLSVCSTLGSLTLPVLSEPCPVCSFCDRTQCSGHGTCNDGTQACDCDAGYSGVVCQLSSSCAGPTSANGTCCPSIALLDLSFNCCVGELTAAGTCCNGKLNACGICNGAVNAVFSVVGQCCLSGVLDAAGLCCASGTLDSFGTCDGIDASGIQEITLMIDASIQYLPPNTSLSLASSAFGIALQAYISDSLNRSANTVSLVDIEVGSQRRLLQHDVHFGKRMLPAASTSVLTRVQLLPYGWSNNVRLSTLRDQLAGNIIATGLAVTAVSAANRLSLCGNGVCELGERPDRQIRLLAWQDAALIAYTLCPYVHLGMVLYAVAMVFVCLVLMLRRAVLAGCQKATRETRVRCVLLDL